MAILNQRPSPGPDRLDPSSNPSNHPPPDARIRTDECHKDAGQADDGHPPVCRCVIDYGVCLSRPTPYLIHINPQLAHSQGADEGPLEVGALDAEDDVARREEAHHAQKRHRVHACRWMRVNVSVESHGPPPSPTPTPLHLSLSLSLTRERLHVAVEDHEQRGGHHEEAWVSDAVWDRSGVTQRHQSIHQSLAPQLSNSPQPFPFLFPPLTEDGDVVGAPPGVALQHHLREASVERQPPVACTSGVFAV